MIKAINNIVKGYITTLAGLALYTITSILLYRGSISFWPDSFIGYSIGTILVLAPRSIEKLFEKFVSFKAKENPEDPKP